MARHTYAFLMLQQGVSTGDLPISLGHKNVKTTQECYAHWSPEHAARAGVAVVYAKRPTNS